jgi:hypothetical protein
MSLKTRITELIDIEHPIVRGGMIFPVRERGGASAIGM